MAPIRRAPATKVPMTSRERGKYYRARLRLHHAQLLRHVAKLRKQLTDLKLLAALQKQLATSPTVVRRAVMKCLRDLLDGNERPSMDLADSTASEGGALEFNARSFTLCGPREAPVLVLKGFVRGKLSSGTIDRLYCCLPGNTPLLNALVNTEVQFASSRSIFFGCDGAVRHQDVETDYSATMAALVPDLRGRSHVLHELERVERAVTMTQEPAWPGYAGHA